MTNDIRTAVKLTRDIRKARADGYEIDDKPRYRVPTVNFGFWGFTPESCLSWNMETRQAVKLVFDALDQDTQHALTFAPKPGEWVDRVQFWQNALREVLPPTLYYQAIMYILGWAHRCKLYGQAGTVQIITGYDGASKVVADDSTGSATVYISACVQSADVYRVTRSLLREVREAEYQKRREERRRILA